MPRTLAGTGRKAGKRCPLNLRTTQDIRDRIEAAARASGRSLAQEIEARIERSFNEDSALGGPEMRWLVNLVTSVFPLAARIYSPTDLDPFRNRAAYRAGMFAVIDGMLIGLPFATPEEITQEIEVLKIRLLQRTAESLAQDLNELRLHP